IGVWPVDDIISGIVGQFLSQVSDLTQRPQRQLVPTVARDNPGIDPRGFRREASRKGSLGQRGFGGGVQGDRPTRLEDHSFWLRHGTPPITASRPLESFPDTS